MFTASALNDQSVDPEILLIESDELRAYEIVSCLAQADEAYVVEECTTAVSSLERIEQGRYALVVFDAQSMAIHTALPGIALLHQRAPHLPLLVLTNHQSEAWTAAAMRAGATQVCCTRPLDAVRVNREVRLAIERHVAEGRIHGLAHRDPLTGVANRKQFNQTLREVLSESALRRFAVMVLDLDGFKAINDTYGHEAGDVILREVAQRLERTVAPSGVVGRLGGDEFGLILSEMTDVASVLGVAERVCADLSAPLAYGSRTLTIQGRVGVAIYPTSATTASDLLEAADRAMYAAKGSESPVHVHLPDGPLTVPAELERSARDRLLLGHVLGGPLGEPVRQVHPDASAPHLRGVHRLVRPGEQLLGGVAGERTKSHANATAHLESPVIDEQRAPNRCEDLLGVGQRLLKARDRGDQNSKLVTPHARDGDRPGGCPHALAEPPQHLIADVVARGCR